MATENVPYLGRSRGVPVRRACPKGGAIGGNVRSCREKSAESIVVDRLGQRRLEGSEQVRISGSSHRSIFGFERRMAFQSTAALFVIQWLESLWQRKDAKLVLNRLVRTRMLVGVGEVPEQSGPLSRPEWFCSLLNRREGFDHSAAHQSMPDAIQPDPAPTIPQKGPAMKIITNEPRAPIPHAPSFGPNEAR